MSLVTASGELSQGLKHAREAWDATREIWQDAVAAEFESRHWTPLADQVAATAIAMDRLAPVLARLYRECS